MLYTLKRISGPEFYYLINGKEYVIGRKNTDIVISDDQSISRKHAIIKVHKDTVSLLDCGSKYGTARNNSKITANTEIILKDNDIVKLGVFQSSYRIESVKIVTTGSGLTNGQKLELKNKITSLGGVVENNWNETCTSVTTQELMLTIKVLHAIIDNKPIVTLDYWHQYISSIKNTKPIPNPEDFKPPIAETLMNRVNLEPNPERKVLFKNKIFVFPTEKIRNKMSDLIAKTGGSSISLQKTPSNLIELIKTKNNYIFIHNDDIKDNSQSIKEISQQLTKLGERTIPIQEIAMAIVLCSCEKDCNPKFNRIHSVFVERPVDSASDIFPLAIETPSDYSESFNEILPKKELIIPESLDADLTMLRPSTSKISDSNREVQTSLKSYITTDNKAPEKKEKQQSFKNPLAVVKPKIAQKKSDNSACLSTKRTVKEPITIPSKKIKLSESPDQSTLHTSQSHSKKRKADKSDCETSSPTPKKSNLINPFSEMKTKVLHKKTTEDNPFAAFKIKKELSNEKNSDTRSEETENCPVQVQTEETTCLDSFNSTCQPSNSSNITWKLKSSFAKLKIDPELEDTYKLFKNTITVELVPSSVVLRKGSTCLSQIFDNTSSSNSTNKKNFKTFKKCMPKRQQTTIISVKDQNISKSKGYDSL